jgi:hypothetical protein
MKQTLTDMQVEYDEPIPTQVCLMGNGMSYDIFSDNTILYG